MCIVDKAKLYVNTYLKLCKAQTCQTSPEEIQMTISKSDCWVGHKIDKRLVQTLRSVLKWGPGYNINHTLCQHVYGVHIVHCNHIYYIILIQELQKLKAGWYCFFVCLFVCLFVCFLLLLFFSFFSFWSSLATVPSDKEPSDKEQ